MPRIARWSLLLAVTACTDPAGPFDGATWDLEVVRVRVYDCDPEAFAVPYPSTPDPAICGTATTVVPLSHDTLRARLTLGDFDPAGTRLPTDTMWFARVTYELATCPASAEECTRTTGEAEGRVWHRARVCRDPPDNFAPPVCAGRPGEPFELIGALVLLEPVIGVTAYIHPFGAAAGDDVTWDPIIGFGRLADTTAFTLRPAH